ncbi:MAG: hypothetical protein JSR17_10985 [Proteobacteria bacterium]|nr:hypothetical protein [Pseudomonadota bacterium]
MAQKSAKMQVPFAMTQETSSGFPPPPPPPPMMLSSVIKDTKVQAKPAPQSKSKAPTKEDMAHSLADEIKRGVTLKKSSTKTAKPIVQPKQSPSVQLKRTSPGTVADNKEPVIDLAGFIDGFVDEQALEKPKQTVKTEIKNEALERALRKIDAKEKERHREQMVFAQMKQFILNWGPESSAQIQEVENCLAAQKAIIQDLNDKLHHLDEAISLREQIEAARDAKIKKEEQSHKEDNEPTATPDTISVMVPLPPPPPPPPSVIPPPPPPPMGLKNVKDRLAPKTKTEDEIKTPTESEKAATKTKQPPNDERAKKLANIFSDPKFLQRAKQRQQAEKEAEDKKELFTQDKSKDKHPQAKSVHQDQADRLTKIQALLAKTDDSDVAAISFPIVLQPFVNSMSITKTKLQRVTVPDLCLLKKEHERVIQSQHGH